MNECPTCSADCRYRLANPTRDGSLCALDAAAQGPLSLREVARLLGVSVRCAHTTEREALAKLEAHARYNPSLARLEGRK